MHPSRPKHDRLARASRGLISWALTIAAGCLLLSFAWPSANIEGWGAVTFEHRITQDDVDALVADGLDVAGYRPVDQLVAWGEPEAWERTEDRLGTNAVQPLAPGDRLDARLAETFGPLLVHVHPDAELAHDVDILALRNLHDGRTLELTVTDAPGLASRLATDPDVLWIERAAGAMVVEDEASALIQAGRMDPSTPTPGYRAWLESHGFDGTGVTVAVVDTGIDAEHPDLAGRVTRRLDYEYPPSADVLGHGTHVAGIIAGQAVGLSGLGGPNGVDDDGLLYGQGVAPGAMLLDQRATPVWLAYTPPPNVWEILTDDARANGASVMSASIATAEGTGRGYIQSAADLDALVRDARPGVDGLQPLTIVMSAGNEGNDGAGEHQITAPKEAKNIISVGASQNIRPEWDAPTYDAIGWYPPGNPENVAIFSSRGPARDGRVSPTITAPGDDIVSARSSTGTTCYVPPHDDEAAGLYAFCSGTSMAAPHVSGAVALLQQWWRLSNSGADPSPAMVRALLVNTAHDLGERDIPNRHEGWGRVDIGAVLDPSAMWNLDDQLQVLTTPGEVARSTVTSDGQSPLRITLAWDDAPGLAGADPALVNDLDLVVTGPGGQTWLGNHLIAGGSQPGGQPDRLNNVENVFLESPRRGAYRIQVLATNLPGDGSPGRGDDTDQDFALVVRRG